VLARLLLARKPEPVLILLKKIEYGQPIAVEWKKCTTICPSLSVVTSMLDLRHDGWGFVYDHYAPEHSGFIAGFRQDRLRYIA
jgi:hypothetical protein